MSERKKDNKDVKFVPARSSMSFSYCDVVSTEERFSQDTKSPISRQELAARTEVRVSALRPIH